MQLYEKGRLKKSVWVNKNIYYIYYDIFNSLKIWIQRKTWFDKYSNKIHVNSKIYKNDEKFREYLFRQLILIDLIKRVFLIDCIVRDLFSFFFFLTLPQTDYAIGWKSRRTSIPPVKIPIISSWKTQPQVIFRLRSIPFICLIVRHCRHIIQQARMKEKR